MAFPGALAFLEWGTNPFVPWFAPLAPWPWFGPFVAGPLTFRGLGAGLGAIPMQTPVPAVPVASLPLPATVQSVVNMQNAALASGAAFKGFSNNLP